MAAKAEEEKALRAKVAADPALAPGDRRPLGATVAAVQQKLDPRADGACASSGFGGSRLLGIAGADRAATWPR